MDLTEAQWKVVEPYIPRRELRPPSKQGGRPWRSARDVLNGVLWVLRTGAPWADLPRRYEGETDDYVLEIEYVKLTRV